MNRRAHPVTLRARLARALAVARSEAGVGLVEAVMAMTIFIIASTALSDVLTSTTNAHGFALQQSLGQEAADAQIENIRALPYDSVGTANGNPGGSVSASEAASAVGVTGLAATVSTSIHYVGDGIPGGYNQLTNYKKIVVTVRRNSDSRQLAAETTFVAPPTRAPYGGINQVALGVTVTDVGDNQPVSGVPIDLQTGPSAPRSDTTDSNGSVLFAGLTSNPTSGSTAYYNVAPTLPDGYVEMSGDTTQTQLSPGQIANVALRVYQPATIIVNVTKDGSPYPDDATVTVTPPNGTPSTYTVSGGSASITDLVPNGQYSVSASTADGLLATTVIKSVPDNYPTDLTSTFDLALVRPNGTLSITASNGTTPVPGASITVTGGPDSVTLTGTTDAAGVLNFATISSGSTTYTVSGTYGAATFQQTGVVVNANSTTNVILGVPAGSVKLTVTAGGSPVPGATVTLTGPNGFSAVGVTNSLGVYTFGNVGTGSGYAVSAADGAATASQGGVSLSTGSTTNVGLSIAVGSVKASVTDGTNPISGATVTITGPNSYTATGTTNASGNYTFTNVGAGSGYTVSAVNGAASASQSSVSVTSGATTTVPLTLPAGQIQATVTAGGTAVAGLTVTLTGPSSYSSTATTNSSGQATFSGIGAGSGYTVSAVDGPATVQQSPVSVSAGATTPVSLSVPMGSIQVTVDAGGSGISGATVALSGSGGFTAPSGTTSTGGTYTFTNVPAGAGYTVTATSGAGSAQQASVTVTASTATPVTIAMPVGSVKVGVSLGATNFANQPVTLTGPHSWSATGTTDSNGAVTFTNVPAGSGYTATTTYGITASQSNISVTSGSTTNVGLAIQAGSLQVTVKNQGGTTLQGVAVTLASTNGVTAAAGTTSSGGTYTFANLPAGGGYTVTAALGPGSVTSASQTISSGTTTPVTVTLPTGSIAVTVKNQSNATLNGVSLGLAGSGSYTATGTTSGSGTYTFTNVPAGSGYTVTATYGAGTVTSSSTTVNSGGTANVSLVIPTGTVTATVTAGGAGVNGLSVGFTGPNGYSASGTTNSSGVVTFSNVPAGTGYSASVTDGAATVTGNATVTSGSTTNVPLVIPVGTVTATVSAGGSAVSSLSVSLTGSNGFSTSGTTNSSGIVTFSNVPAGTGYTASVTDGAATVTASATVTSGSTTSLSMPIPVGSIKVTVKNSTGCAVLSNKTVTISGPNGWTQASQNTNSSGQVTFSNVPAGSGSYTVTSTGNGTASVTVSSGNQTSVTISKNGNC